MEKYKHAKIILASKSPRRVKLLELLGVEFDVCTAYFKEKELETAEKTVTHNAEGKANTISEMLPGNVVLAGDTVIDVNGEQIGKPADIYTARKVLEFLSGKTHRVISAVSMKITNHEIVTELSESFISFDTLNKETIDDYLQRVNATDKAGAYGIQEYGYMLINGVSGEISNVMGLPLGSTFKLLRLARKLGFI
ncbi:MAG: nucleoside triphosphate pyrophosphatase [Caldisericia bacterium]